MNEFDRRVSDTTGTELHADGIEVVQVNVGLKCNQACRHCHLGASPGRTEMMDWATMESVIQVVQKVRPRLVDITGGAPELNPHLKRFVKEVVERRLPTQVRTNLTVLRQPGMEDMGEFYKSHEVRLVGSMPCYLEENVRAQRGAGVYEKSIEAIKALNALGYGIQPELQLDLVYNPCAAALPGAQDALEAAYKKELAERFDIAFTHLLTITNVPIGRFGDELRDRGKAEEYDRLLRDSFNPQTVANVMCIHQISVAWDGTLYDCDFNIALGMPINHGAPTHIREFACDGIARRKIVTGEHCFACTAGRGSSCGGALA